ncbi:GAF domain-containing protein [Synechococcus sp. R5-16]|uniref:GAF domain-containing sensor histidine kinase n=1 Tax=unclassified Synechococcus TaxID=2626047 RepID=UPI0039C4BD63
MLSRQLQAANQIVQELVLLSSQLSSPSSSDSVETRELEQCVLKLAQTLVRQMVDRLGAASARLWIFDPQEGCFQSVAHAGLLSPAHDQIQRIYPDDSPLGRVAQEGLPLLSNNPAQEAWMPAPEWVKANGLRGFVAYPINRGEERLGALALLSRTPLEASFLIVKHAGARRIDLIIQPKAQQDAGSSINPQAPYTHLELKIIDDGCGMPESKSGVDPAQPPGHGHGLLNMRYRAELIGASIAWRNRRFGSGTVVELRVPLPPSPRSCG